MKEETGNAMPLVTALQPSCPEVPPRVGYRLTRFGERFSGLMDGVEGLQSELQKAAR